MERPKVVIIIGPTGVGKSRLALEIGEEFGCEIVSADSMQVYRYMDIGTGKPTLEERQRVKHHLIDIVNPDQPFHAGLYRNLGRMVIEELYKNRIPILVVGGTGLYIKALTQGLCSLPKIDHFIRERLKEEAERKGSDFLYKRLQNVDPETARRLHPHDLMRIIRALEIYDSTGIPISFFHGQHRFGERPFDYLKIGLIMDRERLYSRIDRRVDHMIELGFLNEVKRLLDMGYGSGLKPMQSLGYKHMIKFLNKEVGWNEALREMKRDTRHYAKRQWIWFKADPEIYWRDESLDRKRIFQEIRSFLKEEGSQS